MRETLQDVVHNWQSDEGMTDATMIATQLEVIAEELRISNLIAYQANVEASYARRAPGKPRSTDAVALNQTILARLGLS